MLISKSATRGSSCPTLENCHLISIVLPRHLCKKVTSAPSMYLEGGIRAPTALLLQGLCIRTIWVCFWSSTDSLAETGIWNQLAKAPIGVWGASIMYHSSTKTLHLIGGYRDSFNPIIFTDYPVYQYSIESNLWFTIANRNPSYERMYAPALYVRNDYAISFGGMEMPFDPSVVRNGCFYNDITIYDIGKFRSY